MSRGGGEATTATSVPLPRPTSAPGAAADEVGSTVRTDGGGFGSDGVAACGCPGAGVRPGTNGVRERGFGTLKYEQLYRHETR